LRNLCFKIGKAKMAVIVVAITLKIWYAMNGRMKLCLLFTVPYRRATIIGRCNRAMTLVNVQKSVLINKFNRLKMTQIVRNTARHCPARTIGNVQQQH